MNSEEHKSAVQSNKEWFKLLPLTSKFVCKLLLHNYNPWDLGRDSSQIFPYSMKVQGSSTLQCPVTHFLNEDNNGMLDENEMENSIISNIYDDIKEEKDIFLCETLLMENTASTSSGSGILNSTLDGTDITSNCVETSKRHISIHDKRVLCPFCDLEITNFSRHLLRKHKNEEEVMKIASYEKLSKERLSLIELLRKRGNFIDLARGKIRPVKRPKDHAELAEYTACLYCQGLYKKKFIYKHSKKCKFNKSSCE